MKIFNWNCAGAFRNKLEKPLEFDCDIYVIQECEHPNKFIKNQLLNNYNFLWTGDNYNKGLAIFYRKEISICELEMDLEYRERTLKWFLPIRINNNFDLIAVWTHKAECEAFQYIGQFYWYLENNLKNHINPIFIGDYNSNSFWDSWDRWWNHTDIVKNLQKNHIESIYHIINKEEQGQESIKTFYHRKQLDKGYHIDYVFSDKKFIKQTKVFEIESINKWIKESDHVPIIWEFSE